jgi:imidazoleglycerol phosphate synthase glutamine amidotransferase subunit HisH
MATVTSAPSIYFVHMYEIDNNNNNTKVADELSKETNY